MGDKALRGGDVAVEAFLQERSGTLALVRPVVPAQTLVRRAVLVVERAALRVLEARERRARPEERRDPDVREATVRRARRVRVERSARDRAAEKAVELAVLADRHCRSVLALGLTGARALARCGHERAAVAADQAEGAVVVL